MTEWHDPKKELPEEGRTVIIWVPNRPWYHSEIGKWVFYKIAWIVKGISKEERAKMKECKRKYEWLFGDEYGNNLVPYEWDSFGPDSYNGQEVKAWAFFDEAKVL